MWVCGFAECAALREKPVRISITSNCAANRNGNMWAESPPVNLFIHGRFQTWIGLFSLHRSYCTPLKTAKKKKTAKHALLLNPLRRSFTLIASHINLYNCQPLSVRPWPVSYQVNSYGPRCETWTQELVFRRFPSRPQTALFTGCSLIKTQWNGPPSPWALKPVFSFSIQFLNLYKLLTQLTVHASR